MIVHDMPDLEYHARPDLSSTGARKILESPAKYRYWATHRQEPKAVFDLGTAVHTKVLGTGAGAVAYPPEHLTPSGNVSTKAATVEWAEAQRAAGFTPISPEQMGAVDAMAEAVLAHPTARALFEQPGHPEASLFGTDPDTGVAMRARFDFLPTFDADDPTAVDLKTARNASADGFARAVADHRYDIQAQWYLRLYATETGITLPFRFVVVESAPPYLAAVHELSMEFADMGRAKVIDALEIYAACTATGEWPGYPLDSDPLQPPSWLMFTEGVID